MDYKDLLSKFFSGEAAPEELETLRSWIHENPENRREFDQFNRLCQCSSRNSMDYDTDSAWIDFSNKFNLKSNQRSLKLIDVKLYRVLLAAACISILVLAGSLYSLNKSNEVTRSLSGSKVIVSARYGEKAQLMLPDSTEVLLNSGSKLEYDASYNLRTRNVILTGEAFFRVHTNPDKPFVVQTCEIKIIAKGTRFNVLSFPEDSRIETTLEEGEVIVVNKDGKTRELKPGQQFVYTKQTKNSEIKNIHPDSFTSWRENKLRLFDTPLDESFRRIAREYNVSFNITDSRLLDLKYTATFIDEDIEEVMEMLKVVSPISYKITYRTSVADKNYLKPIIIVAYRKKNFQKTD